MTAQAATFTVTKEADDNGPCDVDDCAFREAVLAANALPGTDVVVLTGGTYRLTIDGIPFESTSISGDIDIRDDLEIRGDPISPVVIEGTLPNERVIETIFSRVEISHLTITGGDSTGGGSGLRAVGGDLVLRNSVITGNHSQSDGGGLLVGLNHVTVVDTTISGNSAAFLGGGIFSNGSSVTPTSMTLVNTTISRNTADSGGGGIYAFSRADRRLINTTIVDNEAPVIDGVLVDFTSLPMTWTNTLTDDECGFIQAPGHLSNGGNMESLGATCFLPDPTDQMNVPDLMLGPLADNGGPTPTHALLPGSPAIDAGVATDCPDTDQRGFPRPVDGDGDGVFYCDVGAYEFGARLSEIPVLGTVGMAALVMLLCGTALRWLRRAVQ